MAKKRYKRPPVEPVVKRDWLRRFEELGESAPQIAVKDSYDVRTVRKQIELAKEEREAREARNQVLRQAIESHYQDLCRYAEYLRHSIQGDRVSADTSGMDSLAAIPVEAHYLEEALRQHLPRSPVWKDLPKLQQLGHKLVQLEKDLENRVRQEVTGHPGLNALLDARKTQAINGMIDILSSQGKAWAQGLPGLKIEDSFSAKASQSGMASVAYGFARMGEVGKVHVTLIKQTLIEIESGMKEWEEWRKLEKTHNELESVKASLRDELAVIILKRIVPGKCKYCPM